MQAYLPFLLASAGLLTHAAETEAQADPSDAWKLSAELSYTDQSGNRVLRLLTGGISVARIHPRYELDSSLRSRYGKSQREVVARSHQATLAVDLDPGQRWSPFLFSEAERDEFRRLDLRFSSGAGAKYTILEAPDSKAEASVSLALLYSHQSLLPSATDPAPGRTDLARWSMRVRGTRELRPGISARHVTFYQPVWDQMADYLLRSDTGMKILLTERLAISLEYQLNRTARPPEGVEPDDRLFKTGLIIDF